MKTHGADLTKMVGVKVIKLKPAFFSLFFYFVYCIHLLLFNFTVKTKAKKKDKKVKAKEARKKKEDSFDEEEEVKPPTIPIPRPPSVLDKKEDMFNRPPPKEALDMASSIKDRLLAQIEQLGANLPPNTLDQLIDELGGPENVAEMTGRKGRVVQNDNGQVTEEVENKPFFFIYNILFVSVGSVRVAL